MFIWHQFRDRPLPQTAYQSGFYFCGLASQSDDDTCGDNMLRPYDDVKTASITSFQFPFVAYANTGKISIWGHTPTGIGGQLTIERKLSTGRNLLGQVVLVGHHAPLSRLFQRWKRDFQRLLAAQAEGVQVQEDDVGLRRPDQLPVTIS